jgi:energy-coupling factor transporter ATP-binding protein EcfA2
MEIIPAVRTASIYGAFNARWLDPEDVARSFVPTLPFKTLVRLQNSLLMGPRGCGKTTLLKMLTRRAQRVWQSERAAKEHQWDDYHSPDFEAIYIPSDVRWSKELGSVQRELPDTPTDAERVQRASVSVSALVEATRVLQEIADEHKLDPTDILKALIKHLQLGPTIPSFREVRLKLVTWMDEIQAKIVKRDSDAIHRHLDNLPPCLTAGALNAITRACDVFREYGEGVAPTRWALCFDELEIAPQWLQTELFDALRSMGDQRFLLKLTWSPILPTDLTPRQERQHDYAAIRMWHGHVADARPFCKEFGTRFLRDRLGSEAVTPYDVFGPSPFAQDDTYADAYSHGAQMWRVMVQLARRDPTFKEYLLEHGLDPDNPIAEEVAVRNESLRKVKPIALLREAYLKNIPDSNRRRRSRKNPTLYFGEDSIYAMSEGNPRLLAGLFNELLDLEIKPSAAGSMFVRPEIQSRVLHLASLRTLTGIKAYPIRRELRGPSLFDLVEKVGKYLHSELVTQDFNADPVGSFFVDRDIGQNVLDELSVGLLIGAFIHVKSSDADISASVVGSRVRLSYMLAPHYGLLFRNYRDMRLSTAMRISAASERLRFSFDGE